MHIRIELDDPSDLEGSLARLRKTLPKTLYNYFPEKKLIGSEWYGFSFYRNDPLLDWNSIGAWCQLCSATALEDESCHLLDSIPPGQLLDIAAPLLIEMIRNGREFEYSINFGSKKKRQGFELSLSEAGKQLVIEFDFRDFPAADEKAIAQLSQVWPVAQKHLPALKAVTLQFGKGVKFDIDTAAKKADAISTSPNQLKLTCSGPAIRRDLNGALQWAAHCEPLYEWTYTNLRLVLLPTDAPKISQQFRQALGRPVAVHFDGFYKDDFHPDQLFEGFPVEGYWQLPMFTIQSGREIYNQMDFWLIQAPKERFIEAEVDGEKYLTKLKGKVDFELYDGPPEKRWNLHKLRKKK